LKFIYWYLTVNIIFLPILYVILYLKALPDFVLILIASLAIPLLTQIKNIKNEFNDYKHKLEIEKRGKKFDLILKNFEKLFNENFLEFRGIEYPENMIDYAKAVVTEKVYLDILFIYLREKNYFELNNFEKTQLSFEIANISRNINLQDLSGGDLQFLWGVYRILCNSERSITIDLDNIPDKTFLETDCFETKFINKYLQKEALISKLTSKSETLNDYRKTLSRLIELGKLDKYGIHQIITGQTDKIERTLTDKTYYFVLINELQKGNDFKDKIKNQLLKGEHIVYAADGWLGIDGGMFSLLLAITKDDCPTKEFYDKYVKNAYKDVDTEGWLSIHKAKFLGDTIFKKRYISRKPSEKALRAIKVKNVFTTGKKSMKLVFRDNLIETYLTTNELLSVLPLNLLLPDLCTEKKDILIENNEEIKSKFGISRLTDWAYPPYSKKEIAQFLRDNYFPTDSIEYWVNNVDIIIREAKDINKALGLTN